MKKWLYRIFWIPVLVIAVLFLVANRQPVTISLDPFNADNPAVTSFPMPLWLWLIFMLFLGLGLGAAGMWFSGAQRRHKARAEHRELKTLRREMAAAAAEKQAREQAAETAAQADPPLLEQAEP